MIDRYTETTRTGYGSRLKGAFGGVIFGLAFGFGSVVLMWWNEGRAVRETRSLEEGASALVAADYARVDPALDGKLVHVGGRVDPPGEIVDHDFGLRVTALGLDRRVEMYQWKEERTTREEKKAGGGTETVTEYRYEQVWDNDLIDSSDFRQPDGHRNPNAFPLTRQRIIAERARFGARTLDIEIVGRLGGWQDYTPTDIEPPEGYVRHEGGFYRGVDPANPRVGDVRVRFRLLHASDYSFVARQAGNGLAPYPTRAGNDVLLIETGLVPAEQMFAAAHRTNTIITWVLRGVGLFACFIGFGLVLRPLSVMFDVVPLLGNLAERGIGLVAGLLAAMVSLATVALAWVFYRPLIGVSLLVLAVVSLVLLLRRRGGAPSPLPAMAGGPPPPPPPPPRA
jgi:hypothetical protein